MSTTVSDELAQTRSWILRAPYRGVRWFDELAENEFLDPAEQHSREQVALQQTIHSAIARVAYYQECFAEYGLGDEAVRDRADLPKLPVLTKRKVFERGADLRADPLPSGERFAGYTRSSGTTGRPVSVAISATTNFLFAVLWHRAARWFRLDAKRKFAEIRRPAQLPRLRDGRTLPNGETIELGAWRYLGRFFDTGPQICFSSANDVEAQVRWLRQHEPAYLWSYPDRMESAAYACPGEKVCTGIAALLSGGSQMTRLMASRMESGFDAPVFQVYGLNEIGRVAVQCEMGRYHVHRENCIVEIVDTDGQPVPAGSRGRIVITALKNYVMPLLRYDAGDLAYATSGACPCGRTLPSFGAISGRFRRYAGLPEGTDERLHVIRDAVEAMPLTVLDALRDYQIHQRSDSRLEVRLVLAGRLPEEAYARINAAWTNAFGHAEPPVTYVDVDELPLSPSGKPYLFSSEFYPADDDG